MPHCNIRRPLTTAAHCLHLPCLASRALVDDLARNRPGTRLIPRRHSAETLANTARGDLVWLGEAGHIASPDLLRILVREFENPDVSSATGVTVPIDGMWTMPRSFPGRHLIRLADRPGKPVAKAPAKGPVMVRRLPRNERLFDPVAEFLKTGDPTAVLAQVDEGTAIICDDAIDFRRMETKA